MMLGLRSLGVVSADAEALAAQLGAQIVQKAPTPGWGAGGPFAEPVEYEMVLPSGARLSADAVSYSLAMSDPGAEMGIIQSMLMSQGPAPAMTLPTTTPGLGPLVAATVAAAPTAAVATPAVQPSITTTAQLQTAAALAPAGVLDWLKANQTLLILGAGAVVLLLALPALRGKG